MHMLYNLETQVPALTRNFPLLAGDFLCKEYSLLRLRKISTELKFFVAIWHFFCLFCVKMC